MRIAIPVYFLDSDTNFEYLKFDSYPWRSVVSEFVTLNYGVSPFIISKLEVSRYLFRTYVGCVYGEHTYELGLSFELLTISSSFKPPLNISTEISLDGSEKVNETENSYMLASIENESVVYMPF